MLTSLSVTSYMKSPVIGVAVDADLETARLLMEEHGISCLAVCGDDGRIVGAVSRTDLLRSGGVHWLPKRTEPLLRLPNKAVAAVMCSPVISVRKEQSVVHAAEQMVKNRVHRVFVVENGDVVGVCSTFEIMKALIDAELDAMVCDYASSRVVSVAASDPVTLAVERLREAQIGGVVVLGDDGRPVGIFTNIEALKARGASADTQVSALMQSRVAFVQATASIQQAAEQAVLTKARRVLVFERARLAGVLSSLDFARALVALAGREEERKPGLRFASQALTSK